MWYSWSIIMNSYILLKKMGYLGPDQPGISTHIKWFLALFWLSYGKYAVPIFLERVESVDTWSLKNPEPQEFISTEKKLN